MTAGLRGWGGSTPSFWTRRALCGCRIPEKGGTDRKFPWDQVRSRFNQGTEGNPHIADPELYPGNLRNVLHHILQGDIPQAQVHRLDGGREQIRAHHEINPIFGGIGIVLPAERVQGPPDVLQARSRKVDLRYADIFELLFNLEGRGGRQGAGNLCTSLLSRFFGVDVVPRFPNLTATLQVGEIPGLLGNQGTLLINLLDSLGGHGVEGIQAENLLELGFR